MKEFKVTCSEDGRITIPLAFRKKLHLTPGEGLILKIVDDELRIISAKQSLKHAQSRVKALAKGNSLVEKLKTLRQEDNDNG